MKYTDIIQERHNKIRTNSFEIVDRRVRSMMLNFIFANGKNISLSYSRLCRSELTTTTLELTFTTEKITIHGKNLTPIHRALVDHRLTFVRESSVPPHHRNENSPIIEKIVAT